MALPIFQFKASFPTDRHGLEPLTLLVNEILRYSGVPEAEAKTIAAEIETAAMKAASSGASDNVTITFDKDGSQLTISLEAPHLPVPYRTERRVPDAS
jgi:hypothetical protein